MHPAIIMRPETPVGDAAELMERWRIERVPVSDRGRLVGVVDRANLVRALVRNWPRGDSRSATSDAEIRDRIVAKIAKQPRGPRASIDVHIENGAVLYNRQMTAACVQRQPPPSMAEYPGLRIRGRGS
jgi:CBS domain-containing protein